jgi:hypothetical protein
LYIINFGISEDGEYWPHANSYVLEFKRIPTEGEYVVLAPTDSRVYRVTLVVHFPLAKGDPYDASVCVVEADTAELKRKWPALVEADFCGTISTSNQA